jgi:hypothetical protein
LGDTVAGDGFDAYAELTVRKDEERQALVWRRPHLRIDLSDYPELI